MASKILMPALSPTMTEGTLAKWFVNVGDQVSAGDLIAEIETDKATMEVEAVDEGKVTKLLIDEGTTSVQVNSIIAVLDGSEDEEIEDKKNDQKNINPVEVDLIIPEIKENIHINEDKINNLKNNQNNKSFASPYVKKISKEKKIDLSFIEGSGPNGRIVKRDIENLNYQNKNFISEKDNKYGDTPTSMRKIIAERTTLTKQTVPHFYLSIESNVDKLLEMRKKINQSSDNKISINDILVKALALSQKMNPKTNVSWINEKIITNKTIDVSIAVALEEGLVTPIIKDADKKGLLEISNEIKYLAKKSKKGKLLPHEYEGGTISISNLGMFGITEFSAIINPPQSSILAVGTIKKHPYFINDEIKNVNILKSTLSADHRVLDGAVAGKLLKDFNDIIENPFELWLSSEDMELI